MSLLAPAIDSTLAGPATVYASGGGTVTIPPPEFTPDPGDPDVEWEPVPARRGPRIEVEIGRAVDRRPVGFIRSADVEDWIGDDVELLAGTAADVTASTHDPIWSLLASSVTLGVDGRRKYEWDPKGYCAWVYRDGRPAAPYLFMAPVDIGGGRVALPMVGPQEQFSYRFLGSPQQVDILGDRGSFEGANPLAGWQIPAGVTATVVTDGVRGTKALRVIGDGWVRSPSVTVAGAAGYSRIVDGQVFGKWHEDIPSDAVVARARTTGTASGAPVYDIDWADEHSGVRPDDTPGWTADPVPFAARLAPGAVPQRSYLELRSFAGHHSYYDLAQLRLSVQTGFPPGTTRDLAEYVVRITRDAQARSLGGWSLGLRTRIRSMTGVETSQRWAHASRIQLRDVLASVLEVDGGPECRITPGWWLDIHGRLGTDRTDIALTNNEVVNPSWTTDPGGQIDDYIVDTGRGAGVTWLAAVVSQPRVENRWRVQAIVQGPAERTLNEIESWARAHARSAARVQATAQALVAWVVADQIRTGDTLLVSLTDGSMGTGERRMRVLRKRYITRSLLCELTLGASDG